MYKELKDVIIVGSGAAGMMAALTVARSNKSCLLLEAGNNIAASNGARAGGPALANTKLQQLEGASVSEEKLYSYMNGFSRGTVNAALLRNAVAKGCDVEHFFDECNVKFTLLPDAYGVGFRARQAFQNNGKARWQPLADQLERLSGEIIFRRKVIDIRKKQEWCFQVTAIEGEDTGKEYCYYGKTVIIASGGYLGSKDMIKEHFGEVNIIPLGNRLSDGTGIRIALSLGGIEDRNWGICANEFSGANSKIRKGQPQLSAETRYAVCGGLLVNRQGRRFMNEQYLSDQPLSIGGEITLREGKFYAVLDSDMYEQLKEKSIYEFYGMPEEWYVGKMNEDPLRKSKKDGFAYAVEDGWAFSGSVKEIMQATGLMDLEKTIKSYNQICEKKRDTQFGKSHYLLKPLKEEKLYVFEYEPSAWCTFGGCKTDEFCRLLNKEQQVIPGVYVAGVDNGSCYCMPYYGNEGAALGLALTTGIVAGEHVAKYLEEIEK